LDIKEIIESSDGMDINNARVSALKEKVTLAESLVRQFNPRTFCEIVDKKELDEAMKEMDREYIDYIDNCKI
jgi:tRNA A37 threonylcarbamoyladenosine dehydratase